ncbi:glycosyltransferase family 2 protein [Paenibacillus apiarius]|uniref:Glycosyltransferase family 2 protein n=1 Tax=Paenibacillus apiarius TaxID=46240 RepID=A0ABT4E0N2_9BACL|nr:glycosyltransferase family 2 protein [Paenibacillus apiarius]MCY9517644.1 glycosyltransferase family 2 protein [Paenibacillus apiarius]MCY9523161.1 glycosyltransferase family 2 protein [Paenibacillus apiarius]MCY9555646.1 glycosyltransferase family 2 protein [Paenibacillus apiarius]MCY9561264.1 glycosyltransferase family 2 protein [Paenibacillus apiarius]MCY9682333.1 glycosyltransferase family 2 protein [Paenibacillus apiarius]
MKLSIVVPCYNEEKNIPLILERFNAVINRDDIEVVLVNNGSTDRTAAVLEEILHKYKFARTIHVEINQGYGYGILQGLKVTRGEYIGWTHADMQTDPNDVIKALCIIEKKGCPQNIFVKGDRKNRPFFDQLFTTGMSMFESIYLRRRLIDINAQPNLFHRTFFSTWINPPHDFSLDLYALYLARSNNLSIERFDVIFPERINGVSSWNKGFASKWKFIKRTINFSVKLKRKGIN